jgi:Protein of unknown function (DUF3309)
MIRCHGYHSNAFATGRFHCATEVEMELVAGVLIGFAVAAVLALPVWRFSRAWGYGPAVVIGIVIIILLGMTYTGRIPGG